ncbi:CPBP family intramembrane glutamic endopeptidase [Streptomyces sp. NPDC047000]|uniref:CPBP family intramembrane glutamic endopeptidase n=1 Tax=Streptomyces sp. NPDC047000 TaxID=3155474 RepID=UPI0033DA78D2
MTSLKLTTQSVKDLFDQTPLTPQRPVRSMWTRLAVMAPAFLVATAVGGGVRALAGTNPVLSLLFGVVVSVAGLALYAYLVRHLEQRPVTELAPDDAKPSLSRGALLGLALFTGTLFFVVLFGSYGTEGGVSVLGLITVFGAMLTPAVLEELLFRAVAFRLLEERFGTRAALIVSAVVFGGLHLVNPGATIWGALAIAIEGGLMLGAVYTATRNIWLVIGIHFGWNFAESGIFGVTVSGADDAQTGLLHGVLTGPEALTGGAFGPEAGLFAILVCSIPTVFYLRSAARRGMLRTGRTS